MKIYKLQGDLDHLASLINRFKKDDDVTILDGCEKKDWKTIEVKFDPPSRKRKLKLKDYSTIAEPVFSKRAVAAMSEITTEGVQYLPIHCIDTDEELYIVNVTRLEDCLDYDKSEYTCYDDNYRVMWIEKYCFCPEKVKDLKVFKLVNAARGKPFVTDEFARKIEEKKLTGFKLELVWDSDKT